MFAAAGTSRQNLAKLHELFRQEGVRDTKIDAILSLAS